MLRRLVRHVSGRRHVAAVVAGSAIILGLRLVGGRPVIGVELALAWDAPRQPDRGAGRVLGGPQGAMGDTGGEHGVGVVGLAMRA